MSEQHFNRINSETETAALNPWNSMWLHPRQTVRYLLETKPRYAIILLAMAAGVSSTLDNASHKNLGDTNELLPLIISALVFGSIGGIITLYVGSWLVSWCGSWIGGSAKAAQLRTVLAWANLPNVWQLLIWLILIVTLGNEMFSSQTPNLDASFGLLAVLLICSAASIVLAVWSIVLAVAGVAEVQGFSSWKAFANLILSLIAFLLIIVVVAFLVMIPVTILAGANA